MTYTLIVEIQDAAEITHSIGNRIQDEPNIYRFMEIPLGTSVDIVATHGGSGCATRFTATSPICVCESLPAPMVEQAIIAFCSNEPIPEIAVITPPGTTASWFDRPQGGQVLAAYTNQYRPRRPGTFFVQTVSRDGSCVSQERIGIRLDQLATKVSVNQTNNLPHQRYSIRYHLFRWR